MHTTLELKIDLLIEIPQNLKGVTYTENMHSFLEREDIGVNLTVTRYTREPLLCVERLSALLNLIMHDIIDQR